MKKRMNYFHVNLYPLIGKPAPVEPPILSIEGTEAKLMMHSVVNFPKQCLSLQASKKAKVKKKNCQFTILRQNGWIPIFCCQPLSISEQTWRIWCIWLYPVPIHTVINTNMLFFWTLYQNCHGLNIFILGYTFKTKKSPWPRKRWNTLQDWRHCPSISTAEIGTRKKSSIRYLVLCLELA